MRRSIYGFFFIVVNFFLSFAFASNAQQLFPRRGASSVKPTDVILKQDIHRFERAIAIIKHYYIKQVSYRSLFEGAISGMVSSLDPHSSYLNAKSFQELKSAVNGKFVGVGIVLTKDKSGALRVISPIDGSPAFKKGLKPQDLILKVGKRQIEDMSLIEAIGLIKGKAGSSVKLTVYRKGLDRPFVVTIVRRVIKIVSVDEKTLEPKYGYIKIKNFQHSTSSRLHAAIKKLLKKNHSLDGLVLDLRNNPGGILAQSAKVVDTFVSATKKNKYNNVIVYTKGRIPSASIRYVAHAGDMLHGVPMVVLINGGSASASEIVAGALQDYHRAVIMGTRSFGKGSVQTPVPLDKKTAIKITIALYYTPAGRVIQAEGIVPDVRVPELSIKTAKGSKRWFDEASYDRHLSGQQQNQVALQQREKTNEEEAKLAQKDYQLYQALLTLKSMQALRK